LQAAAAAAAAAAPKQEKKPEKTTFDLKLTKIEDKQKLAIIKEMRNVVNLNIAEARPFMKNN
jgi:large subunit ribosomal protein L7/L12